MGRQTHSTERLQTEVDHFDHPRGEGTAEEKEKEKTKKPHQLSDRFYIIIISNLLWPLPQTSTINTIVCFCVQWA